MPEKKTRLAQMLTNEQKRREINGREAGELIGVSQQTFAVWTKGTIPRPQHRAGIARFLQISLDMMEELVEEAIESKGNTKLPPLPALATVREAGRVSDRKTGQFKFEAVNAGRKAIPEGRYSVIMDTKIMEPAFLVGTRAWLDPSIWPQVGNDVLVHGDAGRAWVGRLVAMSEEKASVTRYNGEPMTITGVRAVHVFVLSERV